MSFLEHGSSEQGGTDTIIGIMELLKEAMEEIMNNEKKVAQHDPDIGAWTTEKEETTLLSSSSMRQRFFTLPTLLHTFDDTCVYQHHNRGSIQLRRT